MSLLTENIRWVQAMTLEGERLSADDIVVRRDMLAGARIDRLGFRLSFVVVMALFLISLTGSFLAFVETLQFFDPDYSVFALSILPVLAFGYGAFVLRPRRHFTVLLRDGSALAMASRDGTFLTLCLEAFERLWADPEKLNASLYLHAGHRSVDFGPVQAGAPIDGVASQQHDVVPVGLSLPLFSDNDDDDVESLEVKNMPVEGPPQMDAVPSEGDLAEALADVLLEHEPQLDGPVAAEPETHVSSAVMDELDDHHDELPAFPPPVAVEQDRFEPELGEDEAGLPLHVPQRRPIDDEIDYVDELAASLATLGKDDGDDGGANVPPSVFVDVLPRVRTLVGLLRERAPLQGISDAVDVLELMTRKGCSHPREGSALIRSIDVLKNRLVAYPAAIELLDEVEEAGDLARFRT